MLLLPTVIIALSSVGGAGGIALSLKSVADSMDASATNRQTQYQNERNLMRFDAVSKKLEDSLENLGKQRMVITKNFSVFVNAFEKIRNHPSFSQVETKEFPKFNFDEIKNVSIVADEIIGAGLGAMGGSALAAAAASGTTAAVMALGTASTGTKIAELSGAAATKAAYAALGGGAISVGGGGIALGTVVLNAATLGTFVLFEGIAMAYAGSVARKQADKAYQQMIDNEKIIINAIDSQVKIAHLADEMRKVSVEISNKVYKPLVIELRDLVKRKQDYNTFTVDEIYLVENTILVVQILHFLNNTALYKVTKTNDAGEIEEVEPNTDEVKKAMEKSREKSGVLR